MAEKIRIELHIKKIIPPDGITEEELETLPENRQKRIRSVKHAPSKAELFTAGILLRDVLGVTKDGQLRFSEKGKPYLASGECFFSLSHDELYAVLAVAPVEIGVDIEEKKTELIEPLRRRVFTPKEQAFLEQDPERNGAFLWTRLEAALKLSGEGIAGLDHREFSLLEDQKNCTFETVNYEDSVISVAYKSDKGTVLLSVFSPTDRTIKDHLQPQCQASVWAPLRSVPGECHRHSAPPSALHSC